MLVSEPEGRLYNTQPPAEITGPILPGEIWTIHSHESRRKLEDVYNPEHHQTQKTKTDHKISSIFRCCLNHPRLVHNIVKFSTFGRFDVPTNPPSSESDHACWWSDRPRVTTLHVHTRKAGTGSDAAEL